MIRPKHCVNFRVFPAGVRVAEWSKAPDSSSGPRMWAWVQIPLLTQHFWTIKVLLSTNALGVPCIACSDWKG